jgi:hypothetical protein
MHKEGRGNIMRIIGEQTLPYFEPIEKLLKMIETLVQD